MIYKIAVVEDNDLILQTIRINLERKGYEVQLFPNGESFLEVMARQISDLIILDILLPGISGLELLGQIRRRGLSTPVLILTVKKDMNSKIKALEIGADDYLEKPFNMNELMLRVGAILKRAYEQTGAPAMHYMIINGYKINLSTRMSESREGLVKLSEKETLLLTFLSQHPNRTLRREDILEEVWGMDVDPTPRTIDNFILKFRKLYEDNPKNPKHLIAIRNQGYTFIP